MFYTLLGFESVTAGVDGDVDGDGGLGVHELALQSCNAQGF